MKRNIDWSEILLLCLWLIIIFLGCYKLGQESLDISNYKTELHTVQPDETLWELATKNASSSDDLRKWIHMVKEINNRPYNEIYAGEEIIILTEVCLDD